jgi:hypothetical protein
MKEQLKGWASIGITVNLGRFNSVKLELGVEFLLDEATHEEAVQRLNAKIAAAIRSLGLVERYD